MSKPRPGIVIDNCRISRVIDADTIELSVTRKVRCRLVGCWSPETHRTKHPSEKALGLTAKARLETIAHVGDKCLLQICTDGDDEIGDGLTFGRVLGRVWVSGLNPDVSRLMNATGQTFETKAELEAYLTEQDQRGEQ